VAQQLYRETEESKEARRLAAEMRKTEPYYQPVYPGKPGKKNRRELDRLRGRR
jgi:ribosome-associated heat shock protein Hsp15